MWRAEAWSNMEELQAQTIEMLDVVRRTLAGAQGVKIRGAPLSIPRPDSIKPEPQKVENRIESLDDMSKIAAFFARNPK